MNWRGGRSRPSLALLETANGHVDQEQRQDDLKDRLRAI